ncbi:MAG: hypothetical protein ACOCVC_04590 [Spirochaeta sp.]
MTEKWKFIIKRGVLYWGITAALVYTAISVAVRPGLYWPGQLIAALVVFPVAGIAFGNYVWKRTRDNQTEEGDSPPQE